MTNIKTHYGMPEFYDYYCRNSENPVSRKLFNKIVSQFNNQIVDAIINQGLEYTPPVLQFTFCIRKTRRVPKFKDGKLVNTTPIDFKATKQLWSKDPVAAEKKILIRYLNNHTNRNVFRIKAIRTGVFYMNQKYYRFKACRSFQRLLAKRIFNENMDKFDAYNLY